MIVTGRYVGADPGIWAGAPIVPHAEPYPSPGSAPSTGDVTITSIPRAPVTWSAECVAPHVVPGNAEQ